VTVEIATAKASSNPAADEAHPRRWRVLTVLVAASFMAQLDVFIVNVAIPAIDQTFHGASLPALSWVLNAYAIVFAALMVPAGRLADHFGGRRFFLAGVATFTGASVLCALAPLLGVLIAGRALQALGAAMVLPTSLALLFRTFPRCQHTLVVGIWAAAAAIAASAGVCLGGVLVSVDWRWIFLVNLPVGLFAFLGGRRVLPEVRAHAGARLPDLASSLALLAAVTLLVLATVQGPVWGWGSGSTIAVLAAAALATAIALARAARHPAPVIEAALFRSREFKRATIALFLFYVSLATWLLVTVLFLQDAWHWGAVEVGLGIAPAPLTSGLFALNGGRITRRLGRTMPAVLGPSCMALGAVFWLLIAPTSSSYAARFLPGLIVAGAGAGLTQAPLFASTTTLPADRQSTGSAVLNTARQIGSAVGVAILVALLANAHPASLSAFRKGWGLMAGAAALAALTVLVIPTRQAIPEQTLNRAAVARGGEA
jgi:EmrB/QacA subfamily drug resistance transporter